MRRKDLDGIRCCLRKRGRRPRGLCRGKGAHRWPKLLGGIGVADPREVFPEWEKVAHRLKWQEWHPQKTLPHLGFGKFLRPTQQVVLSCLLV